MHDHSPMSQSIMSSTTRSASLALVSSQFLSLLFWEATNDSVNIYQKQRAISHDNPIQIIVNSSQPSWRVSLFLSQWAQKTNPCAQREVMEVSERYISVGGGQCLRETPKKEQFLLGRRELFFRICAHTPAHTTRGRLANTERGRHEALLLPAEISQYHSEERTELWGDLIHEQRRQWPPSSRSERR